MAEDEIRDFQIAVADAVRLNECYNELQDAFFTHPGLPGDEQYLRRGLVIRPATPETETWVHRSNCGEVAERYIRVGIMNRDFQLWIRTANADEEVDYFALGTIDDRTITTGIYITYKHPTPYLYGRPLWVKRVEWRQFFTRTMEERYGVTVMDRAPSFKAGRAPSDSEILAKADEMRGRGLGTYAIAARMRLEAGFENVSTRNVRDLINGRYARTGRSGIRRE